MSTVPCGWCEVEPCECRVLARPCALCDLPCVRIGQGEPNALYENALGKVVVVHSRCKRKLLGRRHGGRARG